MTKNSFVLQARLNGIVAKLSDKQAGVLFKGILDYAENGAVANFEDNAVTVAFEFVRQDLDYAAKKYAETCARRAESGKKGGLANASKNKQMVANASKCYQMQAKDSKAKHIDTDVDVDTDVDINKQQRLTAPKVAGSVQKPEKKLNDLQKFAVSVAERFEEPMDKVQLNIWYKRNCRCLSDILNFCGKNIPLGLETISVCVRRLEKAGLTGGYEAVARNLPEYMAQAKKQMEVINAGN